MSAVLGNGTLATSGLAYYGAGGGGGGGGSSTITTLYASTINASTINSVFLTNTSSFVTETAQVNATLVVNGNLEFGQFGSENALFQDAAGMNIATSPGSTINFYASSGGVPDVVISQGQLSTPTVQVNNINDRVAKTLKIGAAGTGNFYVPAAGTTQTVASFSTVSGHLYQLHIPYLRVQNQPVGVPAAGTWTELVVDTTAATSVDTFDMASVSTIANDLLKAPVYTFVASGAGHNLNAQGFATATLSTAITVGGGALLYLKDLGAVSGMPVVG